jgi:hypothetical protein
MVEANIVSLRRADQVRSDFAVIETELELIQAQLAKLPTRRELAQTALLATLATAALVLLGSLAFGQL